MFLWNRKMQFWQFRRKRFAGRLTIFAQTPKKCRLHLFLKMCSPKNILCISRKKSSFSRYKNVAIRAKSFCSMSEKKIRTSPGQHFSSKLIPRKVRMHMFITTRNVFSTTPKKLKNQKFLESICSTEKLLRKKISSLYSSGSFLVSRWNNMLNVWN